ncbi:MAG TPA: SGNH/GDSL hydrolase family protein [Stellaceae bacterium]|nr:SGNH/GDSL hydrolase family protein [Stellaceae bacterium]
MLQNDRGRPKLGRSAYLALLIVGIAATAGTLLAPAGRHASAAGQSCGIPDKPALLDHPLPHVAQRIAEGGTLTIVALGSSSTWGTGASRPRYSYPSRLEVLLAARFPGLTVRVLNRGVGGEEAPDMAARIDTDVLPAHPDLVIWQVGTNGVLDGMDAARAGDIVRQGIDRIEAAGADVMIMNPQFAPAVLQHPHYRDMLHELRAVAHEKDVPLFPRFSLMRGWADDGFMPLNKMVGRDRLHMTDASYDCLARAVAASIVPNARPVVAADDRVS